MGVPDTPKGYLGLELGLGLGLVLAEDAEGDERRTLFAALVLPRDRRSH
jgi:hypothetical protein